MKNNEDKKLDELIDSFDKFTIRQLFRLIINIKYKTAIVLFTSLLSGASAMFVLGRYTTTQEAAVMLNAPFAMRVEINSKKYDFDTLTLMEDPVSANIEEGKVRLALREIQGPFDITQIGMIIARKTQPTFSIWDYIASINDGNAYAQSAQKFEWNGHEDDYNFTEKFIDEETVYRYYEDGCILSYKVSKSRKSEPTSFVWIVSNH